LIGFEMHKSSAPMIVFCLACLVVFMPVSLAQKTTSQSIDEYRAMLADGNPAELFIAKGEQLWQQARGPNHVSLQRCDLGKGPGVTKGAFVELPRYFSDTQQVQDLESRLVSCMVMLQGFDAAQLINTPPGVGEQNNITALATWIAAESQGMKFNLPFNHPEEKKLYQIGKNLFFLRAGPHDFSCATCHSAEGKRIRLQELPNLTQAPSEGMGYPAWPAYRVSNGQMWGMQLRLNDCFRQQRFPYPGFVSSATIALSVYLGVNSNGAVATAPGLKR
jgi:sulfur-oxidizing protein SoxA